MQSTWHTAGYTEHAVMLAMTRLCVLSHSPRLRPPGIPSPTRNLPEPTPFSPTTLPGTIRTLLFNRWEDTDGEHREGKDPPKATQFHMAEPGFNCH